MRKSVFLLIFSLVLMMGCSKEEKNPVTIDKTTPPEFPQAVMPEVPANAPSSVHVMARSPEAICQGGFAMLSRFQSRQAVFIDSAWTWSGNFDSLAITITSTVNPDGSTSWQVILNGTDDGIVYDHWVAMAGQVSADKKTGSWTFYDSGSSSPAATWTWTIDADGNRSTTLEAEEIKVVFVNNTDGSGNIKSYENDKLFFEAEWKSDHSGWWKLYDDDGTLIREGTWK